MFTSLTLLHFKGLQAVGSGFAQMSRIDGGPVERSKNTSGPAAITPFDTSQTPFG